MQDAGDLAEVVEKVREAVALLRDSVLPAIERLSGRQDTVESTTAQLRQEVEELRALVARITPGSK